MDETRAQISERLYRESFAVELERLLVDALFETYPAANAESNKIFLPTEAMYGGGGVVRRGMLEKSVHDAVLKVRGLVEPQLTYRMTKSGLRVGTSYYSLYRVGKIVFTISSVPDEDSVPRFARFRKLLKEGFIPKASIPFDLGEEFEVAIPVFEDADAWYVLRHGREPFDSAVPQFANIAAIDQDGEIAWSQNLFDAQMERVEYWIGQREIEIKDDPALVTLKKYINVLKLRRSA